MIMMSLGQIELDLSDWANLEFRARTQYLYICIIIIITNSTILKCLCIK